MNMASVMARCGRRKQRNPRRKNIDDESGTRKDVHMEAGGQLDSSGQSDDNEEDSGDQSGSDSKSSSVDESDTENAAMSEDQGDCRNTNISNDTAPASETDCLSSTRENGLNTESSNSSAEEEMSSAEGEKDTPEKTVTEECHDSTTEHGQSEEDKIQELMNRSDTAVIFPEPVSDHDEDKDKQNANDNDGAGSGHESDVTQCQHCNEVFPEEEALTEHLQSAHGDLVDKNSCPKCGASFVLSSQLEKHLELHSPTSQVCKICHKTFANVYRLQRHMISHDESSDLRKFKCPECGKAFKFKHHLKEHIRIHSGEKPFECSNCGKRFSHSGSYSSHMTSKKCWVINPKMRKPEHVKSNVERAEDILRPLIPKVDENGVPDVTSMSSIFSAHYPQAFIPFDPVGSHLQAQYIAHLNGSRPFLPFGPYPPSHMISALIPGLHTGAYSFPVQQEKHIPTDKNPSNMSDTKKDTDTENWPEKQEKKIDENQNTEIVNNAVNGQSDEKEVAKNNDDEDVKDADAPKDKPEDSMDVDLPSEGQSKQDEDAKNPNMLAVKKILQIVDATVTEQKKNKDEKGAISKLSNQNGDARPENGTDKPCDTDKPVSDTEVANETKLSCRNCEEIFQSPIDLHQHERYLCKWNRDVQIRDMVGQEEARPKDLPGSASPCGGQTAGKPVTEEEPGNTSDTSSVDKESRQYHVRSWFSDEQRQILKSHYKVNGRPDKYELTQIANQLGLPKRVVQVWFQNTRAQDRRKGIPIPTASNSNNQAVKSQNGQNDVTKINKSSPYIPVVPPISFNSVVPIKPDLVYYANTKVERQLMNIVCKTPITGYNTSTMQMEPLDLSLRRKPMAAHTNKPYSQSPSARGADEQALNLSKKTNNQSKDQSPRFEDSMIYKYMQQEGMIAHDSDDQSSAHSNRSTPQPSHVPTMQSTGENVVLSCNAVAQQNAHELASSCRSTPEKSLLHCLGLMSASGQPSPTLQPPMSPSIDTASDLASPPPSSLESSFNSTLSLDSAGIERTTNGLYSKAKRARRKSWRQVESDEMQLDLEDALMIDEDPVYKRKRKSWKQHRVDAEEGLYACDQCDKMFNKQSSLARHKYEHSGQRPFSCDVCGKAFKHKHHLTEHKRLHSGEKPFQCTKCGKRFSHSGSYSQHMNHRYKYCKPNQSGGEEDEEP